MPSFDVKKDTIRFRVREHSLFKKDTYLTLQLREGIKNVTARLKSNNNWAIQSLIFDKKLFSLDDVKKWVKSHKSMFSFSIDDRWVDGYNPVTLKI